MSLLRIRCALALTAVGCCASITCGGSITLLHEFSVADGFNPAQGLVFDGTTLYGVTLNGGTSGTYGTVYAIRPDGTSFSTLHSFSGSDGREPRGLALDGGTLYGTTRLEGAFQRGNVYSISTGGTGFGVLHSFAGGLSLAGAWAAPTIAGGRLLGTTLSDSGYAGAVYGLDMGGQNFGLLHGFLGSGAGDGAGPLGELAVIGGRVYGTTGRGGMSNEGTVFVTNSDGSGYQVLHSFSGLSESNPQSRLISDGTRLYGTTIGNGGFGFGTVYSMNLDGSGYQVLHTFLGAEGSLPVGDLALSGSTLYGTAWQGGASGGGGTLFSIDTTGSNFSVLHDFFGGPNDGIQPLGGVTIVGGVLYGTTLGGGDFGNGTVYSFAVPTFGTMSLAVMGGALALRRRRI